MDYVILNNGIQMPILGFGAYQLHDDKESEESIYNALMAGYRLIDTAASYGSEAAVGHAIKSSGIPREKLFITTSCGCRITVMSPLLKLVNGLWRDLGWIILTCI